MALDDGLEGLLHLSEMGDGSLKEPYSYVQKGDRLTLRISHLEPEKRRVGFTQRWGTDDENLIVSSASEEGSPESSDDKATEAEAGAAPESEPESEPSEVDEA